MGRLKYLFAISITVAWLGILHMSFKTMGFDFFSRDRRPSKRK